ncbi:MAG TPA: SRPBCC family protein [Candidatus Limnocylindrales bacterium]|nr:SRPBCC family protein [Candidatus Limnocylindrales bacterium]
MGALVRFLVRLAPFVVTAAWLAERRLRDAAAAEGRDAGRPITTSIAIEAPIERVWAVLADIERQPEWMHDLKSVELLTPLPVGVGTRARGRVQAFGVAVEDPIEITAFSPPSHFAIRHEGLVRGSGDIRLERGPHGSTTTVTWVEVLAPRVLPHLGAAAIALVFAPIFRRDLERLAALVESEA